MNGFFQTQVFNYKILPLNTFQPETILDKDKRGQNVLHYCAENQNINCIEVQNGQIDKTFCVCMK